MSGSLGYDEQCEKTEEKSSASKKCSVEHVQRKSLNYVPTYKVLFGIFNFRNEPATIRKRFFSVFVMSLVSPLFLWYFLDKKYLEKNSLLETLGLRLPGLLPALILPLLLTMVLFLGPLVLQALSGIWQVYAALRHGGTNIYVETHFGLSSTVHSVCRQSLHLGDFSKLSAMEEQTSMWKPILACLVLSIVYVASLYIWSSPLTRCPFWWSNVNDLMWVRNYIVAPLSEEFTFRACMLPLLLQVFKPNTAIFVAPLFFGAAHLHHLMERLQSGMSWRHALLISCFQFSYTSLFGGYSAFLFVRTGHFVAPFLAHAFCNHMGFPDFEEIYAFGEPRRSAVLCVCVVGLIGWAFLLGPMTSPALYSNNLWWR
ncbi:CAAX prenyl protease 2 [Diaphorina citri]|uniref:CAAX prenyl protease 2 n=1 Tax=Diaphorina citri TaxID=121845 RepID=A0A3Q0JEI1_DIACI|nr:CAAX prenyl protease 2 [Diaphorina citri]